MTEGSFGDIFVIPKDIIFPDELNRYLKEQITVFARENALLQKNLEESEQKCIQIQKESEEIKNKLKEDHNNNNNNILPSFASSSHTINSKIVELSKNLRNKCAELEKYKTKYSKLLRELEEIKENEEDLANRAEPQPIKVIKPNDEIFNQMKQLQDKLNATTNKMLELKNANMQLRNDLRQTRKLLQQETGEDFSSLQANSSSWKGRAQVICDLHEKNRTLKEKLKHFQVSEQGATVELTRSNSEKIGSKISTLEKENSDLKSQNEAHKMRIDSLKSRCGMLEMGHQELKVKIQNVKDRHAKDLELTAKMSKQLTEAEQVKKNSIKEKELQIGKLNLELQNSLLQIENYKSLIENLKTRGAAGTSTNENETKDKMDSKQDHAHASCVSSETLADEKHKLLELVNIYKKRLENERNDHERCQHLVRVEKQKAIRLEAAVARSELESAATTRSGYSTMAQAPRNTANSDNDLRSRLELAEENIKALQTRLLLEQNERKQDFQEFAKILSKSTINNKADIV